MTQNDPESTRITFFGQNRGNQFFRSKSTKTTFCGQNRPRLVISVKTHFFQSKSTKTTFFGQNRPNPGFPVKIDQNHFFLAKIDQNQIFRSKPVFPVKINQTHFFRPNRLKLVLSVKTQSVRPKLAMTGFPGQKQPKPAFSFENQFSGQNRPKPLFLAKFDQNNFFLPKLTKTTLSGRKTEK